MKIDIIFVHIAVVAAVAIPYILFILAAARQRRLLKLRFNREAQDLNFKPDQIHSWNSNIIGIDKSLRKVLFIQKGKTSFSVQVIDLKNVKSSLLLHQNTTVKVNKKDVEILQKVELELSMYNGEVQTLSLFDSDITYYQDYEMKNAEKCNQIIGEFIRLRPSIHSAA